MSKELQAWRVSEIVETLREVQDPNEDISPTLARKWLVRDVTDLLAERDATRARLAQLEAVAEAAERVAAWAPPSIVDASNKAAETAATAEAYTRRVRAEALRMVADAWEREAAANGYECEDDDPTRMEWSPRGLRAEAERIEGGS